MDVGDTGLERALPHHMDFQDFRDDCEIDGTVVFNSEVGPMLKTGVVPSHRVCEAPDVVLRSDFD